ncbi:sugar transferase [Qipengyuania huizhouensis]|uniref:sugar transferase n=1 Tax=Qipengyuania huizhouensis TaxID=2867245 RepID=UPI001C86ADB6|nr:sugar transferase [Qipengyuania huizhouensis]MBX7460389.1 sugar transferase [Qipengyuania huizhouensis]
MTLSKRIFDLICSIGLALILSPLFILIYVWIFLLEGKPVFYVSERMKAPTEAFRMVKFRTMRVVPEDRGVSGGDKSDRITRSGRFLRATRLDELPQLWNVVKGDISFVGPRPPLREYVERFPGIYDEVLKSRPGITGLASLNFSKRERELLSQCKNPEETDLVYCQRCIPRKAELDLIYQRNQNICFDVALMWRTALKVVF